MRITKLNTHPGFAEFRGVTVLGLTSGVSLANQEGTSLLNCDLDEPDHKLYKTLKTARSILNEALQHDGFVGILPSNTYHLTLADVLQQQNVALLKSPFHESILDYIRRLPSSTRSPLPPPLDNFNSHRLSKPVTLEFSHLHIWPKGGVLVAKLKPVGGTQALAEIEALRDQYDAAVSPLSDGQVRLNGEYSPHITIAYSTTTAAAEAALHRLPEWQDKIARLFWGVSITFHEVALFGFVDMTRFYLCGPEGHDGTHC